MCVICCSPKGVPQPNLTQIKTMFLNNPHGAGYMTARNGNVEIHKGFLCLEDFIRQLKAERFTKNDVVVYHFRISTQAGTGPEMTHPFPLTSDLELCEKLDVLCSCGIAHNGIINMTSTRNPRYSDTALFITQYMTKLVRSKTDIRDEAILDMLAELTRSKLAILDSSGYLATVGAFIKEENGLMFSNTSYKITPPYVKSPRYRKDYSVFDLL